MNKASLRYLLIFSLFYSASVNAGPTSISYSSNSTLTIAGNNVTLSDTGSIDVGSGNVAVNFDDENGVLINNGTITGNITLNSAAGSVTNNNLITGNINLGSNGAASLTLEESSVMTGNVIMGNANQVVTINGVGALVRYGGSNVGMVSGLGTVNFNIANSVTDELNPVTIFTNIGTYEDRIGTLNINSYSQYVLIAGNRTSANSINLMQNDVHYKLQADSGMSASNITIAENSTLTLVGSSVLEGAIKAESQGGFSSSLILAEAVQHVATGNIGADGYALGLVKIKQGSMLDLATNNASLSAATVAVLDTSSLIIGSGDFDARIISLYEGANDAEDLGSYYNTYGQVTFLNGRTLGHDIGTYSGRALNTVDFHGAASSLSDTFNTGDNDINASFIKICDKCTLNVAGGLYNYIDETSRSTEITLRDNSVINFNEGSLLEGRVISFSYTPTPEDLEDEPEVLAISGAFGTVNINADSEFTFKENSVNSYVVGTSSAAIKNLNIASTKTLSMDGNSINAQNITLGASSTLETGGAIISSAMTMGQNSVLSLTNGANVEDATINGSSSGLGSIQVAESSVVNIGSVGMTNSIGSIITASNSVVNFSEDIRVAEEVSIAGNAIFSQGTTNITTNVLSFVSGSSLSLTISDSTATSLEVAGSAIISENTTLYLTISGTISSKELVTLVSASRASVIGKIPDSKIIINNLNNVYGGNTFRALVRGDNLVITAASGEDLSPPFEKASEKKVYDIITEAPSATGELNIVKAYLENDAYSDNQKKEVIKAVTPEVDNSINRVAFNNINITSNIISARLESLRNANSINSEVSGGVLSSDLGSPQFTNNFFNKPSVAAQTLEPLRDNNIRPSYPLSLSLNDKNSPLNSANGAVWIQTFGSAVNQKTSGQAEGFNANSGGIAVGIDCAKCAKFTIGTSVSYAQSSIKAKDASKNIGIDTYQLNVYGAHNAPAYFVNATLGLTLNNYNSTRHIAVAGVSAKGNYSGHGYNARIELGTRHYFAKDILFTPSLMITAARNIVNSYDEAGAGTLNLHIKNDSINFLEGRVGGELSKFFTSKKGTKLRPQIFASYGYDFIGDKQRVTSNFIGQTTSFESSAAKVAQASIMTGAGISLYTLNDVTVSLNYGFEHRKNYNANSGWFKMRYSF